MPKVGLVLAECYTNTCFAEAVAKGLGLDVKPHHTREMGRDKVLAKAVRPFSFSDTTWQCYIVNRW